MEIQNRLTELIYQRQDCGLVHNSKGQDFVTYNVDLDAHLIAQGVTIPKWIPVTERLPEKGETVLVFGYWHEKFQPLMCYLSPHRKGEWFTSVAGQQVYTVSHWMPMPQPPKKEGTP